MCKIITTQFNEKLDCCSDNRTSVYQLLYKNEFICKRYKILKQIGIVLNMESV